MRKTQFIMSFTLVFSLAVVDIYADVINGNFETGNFNGWTADSNWKVDNNAGRLYTGMEGRYFAWSGGQGEAAIGILKSKPFKLDNDGVEVWMAGWSKFGGAGSAWNYVTLNTADGRELDRVYAPGGLSFTRLVLDGRGYQGESVYLEAVDNADLHAYAMFCVDDVGTTSLPPLKPLPPSPENAGTTSLQPWRPLPPLPEYDPEKSIKLENHLYQVDVNRENGTITRIRDKVGGLDLIREPRLADNFKFSLPLPGKEPWQTIEANYIFGKEQQLTSFEQSCQSMVLHWKGPLKNYLGELFDASVTMKIEFVGDSIEFRLKIDNSTRYIIGEVYHPIIGGVMGLGYTYNDLKKTLFLRSTGIGTSSADMFRVFDNYSVLGAQGPEQFYVYPASASKPWMEFYLPRVNRSMYFCAHDMLEREKILHLEMFPGHSGAPREDGNWPRPEELDGLPVGVLVKYVNIANHPAGQSFEATPVVLQFHDGGWNEGEKIYQQWYKRKKRNEER